MDKTLLNIYATSGTQIDYNQLSKLPQSLIDIYVKTRYQNNLEITPPDYILASPKIKELIKNKIKYKVTELPGGNYLVINNYGGKEWYKNGLRHRENDKPAVIYPSGSKRWYKNGLKHRDNDKPAIIYSDGSKVWYKNGKIHRENDLPAIILSNGSKYWYKNDLRHREDDKPAVIESDGRKRWYKNGKRINK